MIIGHSKREAIDWVQEKLGPYTPRPVAEDTLTGLIERKLVRVDEGMILLEEPVEEERMRSVAKLMLDKRMSISTKAKRRRAVISPINKFDADDMVDDLAQNLADTDYSSDEDTEIN
jgi:hypothetical protein